MKGLIIKSPWIELILEGKKVWEIRGNDAKIRGKIALIKSGTGKVFGTVDLIDVIPLSLEKYQNSEDMHQIMYKKDVLPYPKTYAWVLSNPTIFKEPVPYEHPRGAVIWVNLDDFHA